MKLSAKLFGKDDHPADNGSVQTVSSYSLSKSSGLVATGAFLSIGILAVTAINFSDSDIKASGGQAKTSAKSQAAINIEAEDAKNAPAAASVSANGVSTSVNTSIGPNGVANTKVTVNGQPVDVPANGSSQQTISTPDGQATINVSNNQSQAGSSTTLHSFSTSFNVSNSTSVNSTTEGGSQ